MRRRWPNAVILEPKHLYTSNADWLARWDATLALLTGLVYLTHPDGYYGPGVHKELGEARARSLPLWYLTDDGSFHADAGVQHDQVSSWSWRAWLPSQTVTEPDSAACATRRGKGVR